MPTPTPPSALKSSSKSPNTIAPIRKITSPAPKPGQPTPAPSADSEALLLANKVGNLLMDLDLSQPPDLGANATALGSGKKVAGKGKKGGKKKKVKAAVKDAAAEGDFVDDPDAALVQGAPPANGKRPNRHASCLPPSHSATSSSGVEDAAVDPESPQRPNIVKEASERGVLSFADDVKKEEVEKKDVEKDEIICLKNGMSPRQENRRTGFNMKDEIGAISSYISDALNEANPQNQYSNDAEDLLAVFSDNEIKSRQLAVMRQGGILAHSQALETSSGEVNEMLDLTISKSVRLQKDTHNFQYDENETFEVLTGDSDIEDEGSEDEGNEDEGSYDDMFGELGGEEAS